MFLDVQKCSQNVQNCSQMFRNISKISDVSKCLEEIIEVVKALAEFPNGNSSPKLLGKVQSKLN